jgi:hypothetical protein
MAPGAILLENLLSAILVRRVNGLRRHFVVGLLLRAIGLANGHRSSNSQRRRKQRESQQYPF